MIKNAKVSLAAVKSFEESIRNLKDYSTNLYKGMDCLEQMHQALSISSDELRTSNSEMDDARNVLAGKIKEIEDIISDFRARLSDLNETLNDLESDLSDTDEYYIVTGSDGTEYEFPNREYLVILSEISEVESDISSVERQMEPYLVRLDRAHTIESKLVAHIDATNGVIYSLEEKRNNCKNLRIQLEEIKNGNDKKGTDAWTNLKKIEEIIEGYIKTKMVYDSLPVGNAPSDLYKGSGININVNITKNIVQDLQNNSNNEDPQKSSSEIEKHQIKYDKKGHICEYEGRSYGGKYTSYDERVNRTSVDDPMRGYYTGDRGESKYIPTTRTVEGIIVSEILKQYGLDGIEYRNAEPDFEVCSEAIVHISHMSENRDDYTDINGEPVSGNFSQADIELAKVWSAAGYKGKTKWTDKEIYEYRKANKLTWHEKCDTETMVLVRSEINRFFHHSGGCAECKVRDNVVLDNGGFDE